MAAPLQVFQIDPHYSVFRDILAPALTVPLGGGTVQARRRYARPVYQFRVQDRHATKAQAEYIYSFMQYHQGDIPFFFSGGPWSIVELPLLFGFGDGVRTEFFLNNRHIITGTLTTYADTVLDSPLPSIDLASGLLTYATPPADQARLTAGYQCEYKCTFVSQGETLQSEEHTYANLFKYEGIILREVVP